MPIKFPHISVRYSEPIKIINYNSNDEMYKINLKTISHSNEIPKFSFYKSIKYKDITEALEKLL
jgi:hypothetical protein